MKQDVRKESKKRVRKSAQRSIQKRIMLPILAVMFAISLLSANSVKTGKSVEAATSYPITVKKTDIKHFGPPDVADGALLSNSYGYCVLMRYNYDGVWENAIMDKSGKMIIGDEKGEDWPYKQYPGCKDFLRVTKDGVVSYETVNGDINEYDHFDEVIKVDGTAAYPASSDFAKTLKQNKETKYMIDDVTSCPWVIVDDTTVQVYDSKGKKKNTVTIPSGLKLQYIYDGVGTFRSRGVFYDVMYIDLNGKTVLSYKDCVNYSMAWRDGAFVVLNNEPHSDIYKRYDKSGKVAFTTSAYYDCFYCSEDGLIKAALNSNGKYGYLDEKGKVAIPFEYEDAIAAHEGVAPVKKNGKYGAVDYSGKVIISFEYDAISEYINGVCYALKDGYVYVISLTDGLVNMTYNGRKADYYVKDGKIDLTFTGFVKKNGEYIYCEKGVAKTSSNEVVKGTVNGTSGWWKLKKGKVDLTFTGFAKNSSGWWYCEKGKVNFDKKDVIKGTVNGESGWWFVSGGQVKFVDSVEKNSLGWWRIKNGKADFGYTGFAKNSLGWWYCVNGKVDFNKKDVLKGTVNGESGWWYVSGGKVQFVDSVEKNSSGWWRIKNGKADFNYTGFAKNSLGWWYCINGKVDFNKKDVLKGTVNGESGWWFVSGGQVKFVDSVEKNSLGWWCIQKGKVNFNFTGIAKNSLGSWYCKGGKVQFDFTGKVTFSGKTYNIKAGKVVN